MPLNPEYKKLKEKEKKLTIKLKGYVKEEHKLEKEINKIKKQEERVK